MLSLAVGLLLAGCGSSDSSKSAQTTNTTTTATNTPPDYGSGDPITVPVDYLGAVGQAKKFSEKQIDLAYLNQAIQQFKAEEDRYPKDLNELIPNYIGNVPKAPYGFKIIYDPNTGVVKVVKQ